MDPAQPPESAAASERPPTRPERGGQGDPVIATLKAVSLFDGLDDQDLSRIRRISEALTLLNGETLFEEGDKGDTFFVIVRGAIELSKDSPKGRQKLAVLRKGQAFGEMALLNRTPRSASAVAVEPTTLLTISHDAFADFLGGDSIALRIMKALSKALWATSVRLTAKQSMGNEARAAVGELNRVVRGQLTAKQPPEAPGFDVAVKASFHPKSRGAASWDTFPLEDGRTLVALLKAEGAGMLHAQNLSITRALMREVASRPHEGLAAYMNALNASLHRVAVQGLSHPVTATLVALSDGEIEWGAAGASLALWAGAGVSPTPLRSDAPALGAADAPGYRSERRTVSRGDVFLGLAEGGADVLGRAATVLSGGASRPAADLLSAVVDEVVRADAGISGTFDVIAALILGSGEGGGPAADDGSDAEPLPTFGHEADVEGDAGPLPSFEDESGGEPLPAFDDESGAEPLPGLDDEAEVEPLPMLAMDATEAEPAAEAEEPIRPVIDEGFVLEVEEAEDPGRPG